MKSPNKYEFFLVPRHRRMPWPGMKVEWNFI